MDYLVEAAAGDTGVFAIQAKDAFSNNLWAGGDDFSVLLTHKTDGDVQYRAFVTDHGNGTYMATYTAPIAGPYDVEITHRGEPLLGCPAPSAPYWQRASTAGRYPAGRCKRGARADGRAAAPRPDVDGFGPGYDAARGGRPSTLTIEARDAFGNLRKGDDTPHFVHGYYGGEPQHKGASDYFLVVFDHQAMDYTFTTSTAIQTITINDVSIRAGPASDDGLQSYRLRFAGRTTMDIPVNATAAAVEAALEMAHDGAFACPFPRGGRSSARTRAAAPTTASGARRGGSTSTA